MEYIDGDLPVEKPIPALVANAENNFLQKPQKQVKESVEVKLDRNLTIVKTGYAISGTILIRDSFGLNNTIVHKKIHDEIDKRIALVKITDDFGLPTEVHIFDKLMNNSIKNVYFEKFSDCNIEIFGQTIKFSEFIRNIKVSDKILDIINNFNKLKNKEGLIEIKFNFIMPTFKA